MKKMILLIGIYLFVAMNVFGQSLIASDPHYPSVYFRNTTTSTDRPLYSDINEGGRLKYRYDGINDAVMLHSVNFNSFVPSLTGAGASGSWNINAASAGVWSGQSFIGAGDNIGFYMLGQSTGTSWAAYTPDKVRTWLSLLPNGETLQSVTDRGNQITNALIVNKAQGNWISGNFGDNSGNNRVVMGFLSGVATIGAHNAALDRWANLAINSEGGNVGIGVTNPTYKLDISEGLRIGAINPGGPMLTIADDAVLYDDQNGSLRLHMNYGGSLQIDNGGLTTAGRVGIGTTTPQSELAVKGTITSTKVKVTQTGWPDYVFEPSYNLPSLPQIETFIQQNKHLPEVPSAAEVKKEGLDLGDNQAILLKKIEELTLYVIQQNKQIFQQNEHLNTQNKQLTQQAEEMEQVKRRLAELETKR